MFCRSCGTELKAGNQFCTNCGAPVPAAAATPTTPSAPAAAPTTVSTAAIGNTIKQYLSLILLVVGVLALILAIIHTFSLYDVTATVSFGDESESQSGPFSDIIESGDGSYVPALIGNILFGLTNLGIAAVGILFFLKQANILPLYNSLFGKLFKGKDPTFLVGVAGGAVALLQIILYAVCTQSTWGISVSISAHWTTWVFLFVYALLAVADKFLINPKPKAAPAVTAPPAPPAPPAQPM